jgi:hypothetical protein
MRDVGWTVPDAGEFVRVPHWSILALTVAMPLVLAFRPASQAVVQVTVNARCAGPNNTEVTVRPWNVRLRQGDQLEWVIAANANSNDITITPKSSSGWPFASREPINGTKGRPARANGMRANGRGTYKYNIALVCQSGQNPPDSVIIDPDVIVD